jgi:DNA-binding Lrp family transcriptional regulator
MTATLTVSPEEATNRAILAVSEDRLEGFHRDPFGEIARQSGLPLDTVIARIRAMLEAGVIRRVRQTLLTTSLAHGALVAWQVPEGRLRDAFEWMAREDPFTGHVVIRTTDPGVAGAAYRLWTTLKVPQGYDLEAHCAHVARVVGAERWKAMPAKKLFALGVGHMRRRDLRPGDRTDAPGAVIDTEIVELTRREWEVLAALKRELSLQEIRPDVWADRAAEAGLTLDGFYAAAESLAAKGIVGRFSTFLEHVKPVAEGERVTRYNALFHWRVAPGQELDAGREVARHHIMTHAYWREGGPEFKDVNIMGVAHGLEKDVVLAHKAAIDAHLAEAGIDVSYTNVFWGGRSEIKPSEILPQAYEAWCRGQGIDPATMLQSARPGASG